MLALDPAASHHVPASQAVLSKNFNDFPAPRFDPIQSHGHDASDSIGSDPKASMMMLIANDAHRVALIKQTSKYPTLRLLAYGVSRPFRFFGLSPAQTLVLKDAVNIPAQTLHTVTKIYRHAASQGPENSAEAVDAFHDEFEKLDPTHQSLLKTGTGVPLANLTWPTA